VQGRTGHAAGGRRYYGQRDVAAALAARTAALPAYRPGLRDARDLPGPGFTPALRHGLLSPAQRPESRHLVAPGADALAGTAPARDLLILTALAAAALIGAVTSFTRRDLTR